MNNSTHGKKYYTKEEYFTLEETAIEKSEFDNGEIYAMSGGSANHSLITGNIITILNNALANKNCRAFGSDMKLEIAMANSFVYPDSMVICGKIQFAQGRNDLVKNPVLVVEVLSSSTESYDRGRNLKNTRIYLPSGNMCWFPRQNPWLKLSSTRQKTTGCIL